MAFESADVEYFRHSETEGRQVKGSCEDTVIRTSRLELIKTLPHLSAGASNIKVQPKNRGREEEREGFAVVALVVVPS